VKIEFILTTHYSRWRKQFKQLLEETGYVTPGKMLAEVRVLFMGRECFEALSEQDCQQIYDQHQKEIIDKAKHNFQVHTKGKHASTVDSHHVVCRSCCWNTLTCSTTSRALLRPAQLLRTT
jgi:hypothetical protein